MGRIISGLAVVDFERMSRNLEKGILGSRTGMSREIRALYRKVRRCVLCI